MIPLIFKAIFVLIWRSKSRQKTDLFKNSQILLNLHQLIEFDIMNEMAIKIAINTIADKKFLMADTPAPVGVAIWTNMLANFQIIRLIGPIINIPIGNAT